MEVVRRMGQVASSSSGAAVLNWTSILANAGLEAPGYKEAADATARAWAEKEKVRKAVRMAKGRKGVFPSLKHGAD